MVLPTLMIPVLSDAVSGPLESYTGFFENSRWFVNKVWLNGGNMAAKYRTQSYLEIEVIFQEKAV